MRMAYLGAAYAPCMRREPSVMENVRNVRQARQDEGGWAAQRRCHTAAPVQRSAP